MEKNSFFHDDVPLIQLTVGQMKNIIESVFQGMLSLKEDSKSHVLTIEEVSELTGYKKATIYKLTHERKIPFHKPAHGGRRIFFQREEIVQWLQSNSIKTYQMDFENWKDSDNLKKKSYEKERFCFLCFLL